MARVHLSGSVIALVFGTFALAGHAQAAVSAAEAAALGNALTEVGAEKAASADGRIPEYSGGLVQPPAAHQSGDSRLIDPFADEKPLSSLTGATLGADTSQLTAGTLALLRANPGFRVDIYPTHRTVAYPQWFLRNTQRNATGAASKDSGLGLANVLPGIPFPIPKDGREVMWNHRLHYMGRAMTLKYDSWLVDGSGQSTLTSTAQSVWDFPAFDPTRDSPLRGDEPFFQWKIDYSGPQRRAGEAMLLIDAVNPLEQVRRVWSYLPGQRRARQVDLPDDAPHGSSSGTYANDDAFVYTGVLERFDVKLLGKREILVPYNTYRLSYHPTIGEILQPRYLNPDFVRWELHRVWVVEATLKPGQHHLYGRRVFYVDEDSWAALAADEYDVDGKLLRAVFSLPTYNYDAGVFFTVNHVAYDLGSGAYFLAFFPGPYSGARYGKPLPASQWSPDSLAGAGVR